MNYSDSLKSMRRVMFWRNVKPLLVPLVIAAVMLVAYFVL